MLEYMRAGGGIMWIIALLSFVALAVVLERFFFFTRSRTDLGRLEAGLARALRDGDLETALALVGAGNSSLHRLFAAAFSCWELPDETVRLLAERRVRQELYRWERHLPILEVTARVAPLLGLLGTVLGMVEMFRSLHQGGAVDAIAVTGGIWKALFTTVAGLVAAIPMVLAHSLLQGAVDSQAETLERGVDFLLRERAAREVRRPEP